MIQDGNPLRIQHAALEVDLTGHVQPDDTLSPEGHQKLREAVKRMTVLRYPTQDQAKIAEKVDAILGGTESLSAHQVVITFYTRIIIDSLERHFAPLTAATEALTHLAQVIDASPTVSTAHVFGAGECNGHVTAAINMMMRAKMVLETMLTCQCMGGSDLGKHPGAVSDTN